MAKEVKKDPQELTVEQKLTALFQLQTMLSKIDEIKTLRGELPLEVQDLEDEIAGLSTRIERIKTEIAELRTSIAGKKVEIETAKASVAKYKEQQENVRNNREYDFLSTTPVVPDPIKGSNIRAPGSVRALINLCGMATGNWHGCSVFSICKALTFGISQTSDGFFPRGFPLS